MRKLEAFLGLRVVTYAVMSNHFHLLVEEPDRDQLPALDRDTLLRRLGFLYDRFTVEDVRAELDRAAATGNSVWEAQILARYERRMGDVSIFMKELKQRFTQWYNRRMGRKGTLWEERFKSVLVEGDDHDEPGADAVRGILDGHVVLDRAIAEAGRYPPVDVLRSVSRSMPGVLAEQEWELVAEAKRLLSTYNEVKDLVRLGAYRTGNDPEADAAVKLAPRIEAVLRQRKGEVSPVEESFAALAQAIDGA
jgi:REP element-mobilizing transposase RayT